ncbi:MAG: hypoxanthine phosphoribosyltransferase [Candidatus Brocadiia bacterium]
MPPQPGNAQRPFETVLSADEIERAVGRLAEQIGRNYRGPEPLLVLGVLKGVVVFMADLIRRLPVPLEVEFVRAASYTGQSRGELEMKDDLEELPVEGRSVLLVDCVLDTGRTLSRLRRLLEQLRPASLEICVLLSKQREREMPIEPDYVGAEVPDVFLVGYGLDCDSRWRHLPYVGRYDPDADLYTN